MNIKIEFVNPPIPIRSYDWSAWIDGNEKTVCFGKTEQEAIDNLLLETEGKWIVKVEGKTFQQMAQAMTEGLK